MIKKHTYANLRGEEAESHFNNFIIDSWSYSKVGAFARNPKAFEMQYIYRERGRSSAATIGGSAYHAALEQFFLVFKAENRKMDVVELEMIAFAFINETPANYWKLQKTTPNIEKCIEVATKAVTQLLRNFINEINTYLDDVDEILEVESKYTEWLRINGVDIPIPCHARLDMVFRHKNGKVIIVDHKSKKSFTDDKDAKLVVAKQAVIYASVYEARTGVYPDEVWIMENKYSKNKNGSAQIVPIVVILDQDTRRLYEALLYEPLRSMIQAISDPDFVYLINDNDSFQDKAEIFDFWCRTQIAEVDDFDIQEDKKEMVENRLKKIRSSDSKQVSPSVIKNFKKAASNFINYDLSNKDMTNPQRIEHVLQAFGKRVEIEHEFNGYSSDTFLLSMTAGETITSIYKHQLDIANALNVKNVRMSRELLVYKGKSYIAIEVAKKRDGVLKFDPSKLEDMKIPIGEDNFGQSAVWDFNNHSTPHALICGSTGSGKTVCVKTIVEYARLAGIKKIYIFDPKGIDFNEYKLTSGIEIYNDIEDIEAMTACLVDEMEDRRKSGNTDKVLIVFDEFADAIANSRKGNALKVYENEVIGEYKNGLVKTKRVHVSTLKSLAENQGLLLQKSRALGFRIAVTTQRASTKIISGDYKVNLPVQICFKVDKEVSSRVVIDEPGAEMLTGYGDGLIKSPEYSDIVRFQGYFKE